MGSYSHAIHPRSVTPRSSSHFTLVHKYITRGRNGVSPPRRASSTSVCETRHTKPGTIIRVQRWVPARRPVAKKTVSKERE
ncbi:hypothetical protein OF83DRAFT_1115345 [Amylostereum chailletii]|nr:hypothetical protein OF83DRAFT_1115345 [Amylostereum chailletii]